MKNLYNIAFKLEEKERLIQEFYDLKYENLNLYNLILDLSDFISRKFGKTTTITHLFRLEIEQDFFYKNSEKYQIKKFKSPHQFWHAIDIRVRDYNLQEIKEIEDYLNRKYNAKNYYKWTAKNHNIGFGDHFHIQFLEKHNG